VRGADWLTARASHSWGRFVEKRKNGSTEPKAGAEPRESIGVAFRSLVHGLEDAPGRFLGAAFMKGTTGACRRVVARGLALAAVSILSLACERKAKMEEKVVLSEGSETAADVELPVPPIESLILDPALDDLSAPFAGLRVRTVGSAWGESARIILLLHGYGARGDDLVPLAARLHERLPATYLLAEAPYALERGGRAWFGRDRKNFDLGLSYARALLKYCAEESKGARLVVGGFSQGAMLTANLLSDLPEPVVGGLLFSPAAHLPHPPTPETRRVPLFLSHGTKDAVLPFAEGVALRDRLMSLGFQVQFVEFEGRHQIPQSVVEEAIRFLERVMRAPKAE
jgi:phospholipase/carboxylesterase